MPDTEPVESKIREAFTKYPKRNYPKGQILIFADETPEYILYMTKGRVRKYDVSYRGDELIVNIFKPLAFFPISEAINHSLNKYFYKTETETEVHIVPKDAALKFLKDNPDVMLDLLSRVYRGIEGVIGRMIHLMASSAKSRLLYELFIESQRFGKEDGGGGNELDITEVDLAARTGLSRETISREMKQLKTDGLVSVSSRGIKIKDVNTLKKKVGV